jgi:hypothetical protein
MNTEPKLTTSQLADSIWEFHNSLRHERFSKLLNTFLTAGRIELAIEILKLQQLDTIAGAIDKIAVEGITAPLDSQT